MNADPLPDEETVAALRWSSKLTQDANVLNLIQSLPIGVIEEQVALYRKHEATKTAVAETTSTAKITLGPKAMLSLRHKLACRCHMFRQKALKDRKPNAVLDLRKHFIS